MRVANSNKMSKIDEGHHIISDTNAQLLIVMFSFEFSRHNWIRLHNGLHFLLFTFPCFRHSVHSHFESNAGLLSFAKAIAAWCGKSTSGHQLDSTIGQKDGRHVLWR